MNEKFFIRHRWPSLFITGLVILFFLRVILFAGWYGGIEHDSGWNLGLAKNLALHGIYASYTNTIASEGLGSFPSIHRRFSVQDSLGFEYFPGGVGVGPGYIVPEAIIIKIFGSGWWQYRAWPLIGFCFLISLTFLIIWRFGGLFSLIFLSVWLWLIPQFTVQMAYEAFSEHLAWMYLLAGYFLLYLIDTGKKSLYLSLSSGVLFSLALLTKSIFILTAVGSLVYLQWDYFKYSTQRDYFLKKWVVFFVGLLLPILLFYSYQHQYVISHFGTAGLQAVREDARLSFIRSGSGLDPLGKNFQDPDLMYKKFIIWSDIGLKAPFLVWLMFLFSPLIYLIRLPSPGKVFWTSLYLGAFISFSWFMFFSTDGWARHIWQGLFIAMMLISLEMGLIYKNLTKLHQKIFLAILVPVCLLLINFSVVNASPILDQTTIDSWQNIRQIRGVDGLPTNFLLSLSDQQQVMDYFSKHVRPADRVFYIGWYLNAEISPLVDKIFYPLDRYLNDQQTNPDRGNSYVIIGPYQQGIWSNQPPDYTAQVEKAICHQIVLQNPSYTLCLLKNDIKL